MNARDKFIRQELNKLESFFQNTNFQESLALVIEEVHRIFQITSENTSLTDDMVRTILAKVTLIQCGLATPQLHLLNAVQMIDNLKHHILLLTDQNCVFEVIEDEDAKKHSPSSDTLAILLKKVMEESPSCFKL